MRVAPASNIARASSIPFTPPEAFTPRALTDGSPHKRDVVRRRTAFCKSGRGFYKIGTGIFCGEAGADLFVVGKKSGLDDHLAENVVFVGGIDHGPDVIFDQAVVAGLQRPMLMTISTSRAPLKIARRAS